MSKKAGKIYAWDWIERELDAVETFNLLGRRAEKVRKVSIIEKQLKEAKEEVLSLNTTINNYGKDMEACGYDGCTMPVGSLPYESFDGMCEDCANLHHEANLHHLKWCEEEDELANQIYLDRNSDIFR